MREPDFRRLWNHWHKREKAGEVPFEPLPEVLVGKTTPLDLNLAEDDDMDDDEDEELLDWTAMLDSGNLYKFEAQIDPQLTISPEDANLFAAATAHLNGLDPSVGQTSVHSAGAPPSFPPKRAGTGGNDGLLPSPESQNPPVAAASTTPMSEQGPEQTGGSATFNSGTTSAIQPEPPVSASPSPPAITASSLDGAPQSCPTPSSPGVDTPIIPSLPQPTSVPPEHEIGPLSGRKRKEVGTGSSQKKAKKSKSATSNPLPPARSSGRLVAQKHKEFIAEKIVKATNSEWPAFIPWKFEGPAWDILLHSCAHKAIKRKIPQFSKEDYARIVDMYCTLEYNLPPPPISILPAAVSTNDPEVLQTWVRDFREWKEGARDEPDILYEHFVANDVHEKAIANWIRALPFDTLPNMTDEQVLAIKWFRPRGEGLTHVLFAIRFWAQSLHFKKVKKANMPMEIGWALNGVQNVIQRIERSDTMYVTTSVPPGL